MTDPHSPEDRAFRAEIIISDILKWGVAISLLLMLAGTVLSFVRDGDYGSGAGTHADLSRLIAHDASFPRSLARLWDGLLHLRGAAVIVLGLILLILTPVLRVAVAIPVFLIERDRRYALISLSVLVLLIVSFFLGNAE